MTWLGDGVPLILKCPHLVQLLGPRRSVPSTLGSSKHGSVLRVLLQAAGVGFKGVRLLLLPQKQGSCLRYASVKDGHMGYLFCHICFISINILNF